MAIYQFKPYVTGTSIDELDIPVYNPSGLTSSNIDLLQKDSDFIQSINNITSQILSGNWQIHTPDTDDEGKKELYQDQKGLIKYCLTDALIYDTSFHLIMENMLSFLKLQMSITQLYYGWGKGKYKDKLVLKTAATAIEPVKEQMIEIYKDTATNQIYKIVNDAQEEPYNIIEAQKNKFGLYDYDGVWDDIIYIDWYANDSNIKAAYDWAWSKKAINVMKAKLMSLASQIMTVTKKDATVWTAGSNADKQWQEMKAHVIQGGLLDFPPGIEANVMRVLQDASTISDLAAAADHCGTQIKKVLGYLDILGESGGGEGWKKAETQKGEKNEYLSKLTKNFQATALRKLVHSILIKNYTPEQCIAPPYIVLNDIKYDPTTAERVQIVASLIQGNMIPRTYEEINIARRFVGYEELSEMEKEELKTFLEMNPNPPVANSPENKQEYQFSINTAPKKTDIKSFLAAREREINSELSDFNSFLQDQYDVMDGMLTKTEDQIKNTLAEGYNIAKTKRVGGVETITAEGNSTLRKKMKSEVKKLSNNLYTKLTSSNWENKLFKKANSTSNLITKYYQKQLASKTVIMTKDEYDLYMDGYKSNVKGIIVDQTPRQINEQIDENFASGVMKKAALEQIDTIQFNRNTYKLSVLSHPRGMTRQSIIKWGQENGYTNWKMIVPPDAERQLVNAAAKKGKIAEFEITKNGAPILPKTNTSPTLPYSQTLAGLYQIKTVEKWNQGTTIANADTMKGLGLHHNSIEYYIPIEGEYMVEAEEISKKQRQNLNEKIEKRKQ